MAYQNNPEGALIQFASPDEAKRAMQSTEAVLNNRFIKVHWFRDDGSDGHGLGPGSHSQQHQPPIVKTHSYHVVIVNFIVKVKNVNVSLQSLQFYKSSKPHVDIIQYICGAAAIKID